MLGKRCMAKKQNLISLFSSMVSKVFEKLVNSLFQYGFRSSQSSADLLTVASDRITNAFNRSGATQAITFDISKAFDKVGQTGLLHKLNFYGISGHILGLISFFLSNRHL